MQDMIAKRQANCIGVVRCTRLPSITCPVRVPVCILASTLMVCLRLLKLAAKEFFSGFDDQNPYHYTYDYKVLRVAISDIALSLFGPHEYEVRCAVSF